MPSNGSTRRIRRVFLLTLVTCVLAGCRQHGHEAEQPARTRYDCLIIQSDGTVVTSKGFPQYYRAAKAPRNESVAPAFQSSALLMGTLVTVTVYDMDPKQAKAAVDAALGRIADLSNKLNLFDPKSEVSQVNREAWKAPVEVDPDLAGILRHSREIAALTGGAFDTTCGPVTALWRERRATGKVPTDKEVKRARSLVGFDKVTLTEGDKPTVKFARNGMSFDFGGIAKGLASEEAAKVLISRGVRSAIIACSGNVKLLGRRPDGKPFRIGIVDPKAAEASAKDDAGGTERVDYLLPLCDACIDTSGNYRQFTIIEGRRYSHIVDPRTGNAIEALPSVTVIGPDSTLCDALSTAISVLGEKEGLELIERVNAGCAGPGGASAPGQSRR